jgi:hypothetical protein
VDGGVGTGGDAQTIEIAAGVVDHRFPVSKAQGPVGADLDAFPGTAAFIGINDNLHGLTSILEQSIIKFLAIVHYPAQAQTFM